MSSPVKTAYNFAVTLESSLHWRRNGSKWNIWNSHAKTCLRCFWNAFWWHSENVYFDVTLESSLHQRRHGSKWYISKMIDLSAAFDMVDHDLLLGKLQLFGLAESLLSCHGSEVISLWMAASHLHWSLTVCPRGPFWLPYYASCSQITYLIWCINIKQSAVKTVWQLCCDIWVKSSPAKIWP